MDRGQECRDRGAKLAHGRGVRVVGRTGGDVGEAGEAVAQAVVRGGLELVGIGEGDHERVLRLDLAAGVAESERGELLGAGEAGGAVAPGHSTAVVSLPEASQAWQR